MTVSPDKGFRWKVALTFGVVSASVFYVPFVSRHIPFPLLILVGLPIAALGMLFGVLSLTEQEKKTPFAVSAILLSVAGPAHIGISFIWAAFHFRWGG